jgi:signal transduction histidine kinase
LPLIQTDHAKLALVLDNLINNAIKFTTAGTISVTVTASHDQQRVQFRVQDTGPGIGEADRRAIFEPFYQVDGSLTRRHGGLGLGLAIVRSYVGLLDGEVTVESALGRGTCFDVAIPYVPHWARGNGRARAGAAPTHPTGSAEGAAATGS